MVETMLLLCEDARDVFEAILVDDGPLGGGAPPFACEHLSLCAYDAELSPEFVDARAQACMVGRMVCCM